MNAPSHPAGNGRRDTEQRFRPVPASVIQKLHTLLKEQMPNSAYRARIRLLDRLLVFEDPALIGYQDPVINRLTRHS